MKNLVLLFCIIVVVYSAKTCIQNPKYECGDNEYCLVHRDQVKCCPFKGNICGGGSTCCPDYAPTCFSDGLTCGVGSRGAFEVKIQSEVKEATPKINQEEDENEFFKLVENVQNNNELETAQTETTQNNTNQDLVTFSTLPPPTITKTVKAYGFLLIGLITLVVVAVVVFVVFSIRL